MLRTAVISCVMAIILAFPAYGLDSDNNPNAYINEQFPKLSELYRDELSKSKAHYIFAIDVSGSMNKYAPAVTGSLREFVRALPDGDRFDVIPFGAEAITSAMDYCGIISRPVKDALEKNVSCIYSNPSYSRDFKAYTDIEAAVGATAESMNTNREYKINVVVIITDFCNDVPGSSPTARCLSDEQLDKLSQAVNSASYGSYFRPTALCLNPGTKAPGYCLDQLKDRVFSAGDSRLEIVSLSNPGQMISQWFEQLKRSIMMTKLKAIIDAENRSNPVRLVTDVDIDGNVKAEISWEPSRLYQELTVDTAAITQPGFRLVVNEDAMITTDRRDVEEKLGQIRHDSWGFHHFDDSVCIAVSLPTPFDEELIKLGIVKPIPAAANPADRWVWTFFLPFWLCCVILALLALYLMWVMSAVKRNSRTKINADVTIFDEDHEQVGSTRHPKSLTRLAVGKGGNGGCSVIDCEWQVELCRVKSNPWLPWTKPCFSWRRTQGQAYKGTRKGDCSGRFNDRGGRVDLTCGPKDGAATHYIRIKMKPSK